MYFFHSIYFFKVIWFDDVFPNANAAENMIEILLDIFLSLDPNLEFCLHAGLKQQEDQLSYLIKTKGVFNEALIHFDAKILASNQGKTTHFKFLTVF